MSNISLFTLLKANIYALPRNNGETSYHLLYMRKSKNSENMEFDKGQLNQSLKSREVMKKLHSLQQTANRVSMYYVV